MLFAASRVPALGAPERPGARRRRAGPGAGRPGRTAARSAPPRTCTAVDEIAGREPAPAGPRSSGFDRDAVPGAGAEREIDELRELLGLRRGRPRAGSGSTPGDRLRRDRTWSARRVIDRGERDGLVDGMTVMTSRGLVGGSS